MSTQLETKVQKCNSITIKFCALNPHLSWSQVKGSVPMQFCGWLENMRNFYFYVQDFPLCKEEVNLSCWEDKESLQHNGAKQDLQVSEPCFYSKILQVPHPQFLKSWLSWEGVNQTTKHCFHEPSAGIHK